MLFSSMLLVLASGGAAPLGAQTRPLITEEAWIARSGSIVLEVGADTMTAVPNFVTGEPRDRYDLPVLRLVFSPADTVELDLEWVARVIARDDPTFGDVSDFGDVTLRAKTRLWRGERSAIAVRFAVALPQTNQARGLGPNTLRMSADLLWSVEAGPARFHANAGLAIQDRPLQAHEQSDFLAYGVAAEVAVAAGLRAVGEIAGLGGTGAPGAEEHAEVRAGLRYEAGAVGLDAAVRRGLRDADGTWGFTAGLRVRLN